MRHLFFTFLLLLTAAAFAEGEPEADTFLYQISKPGQPVSYLIGTIHVGRVGAVLPTGYRRTLDRTAQLVVEADEESMDGADTDRMRQMMSDTRPLKTSLGAARMQRLQRILATGQEPLPFSPESKIKPWAFWLAGQSLFTPKGYSYRYGIDNLLIQTAKRQQKPVIALEHGEQIGYFARLPEEAVIRSFDSLETHHRAFLNEIVSLERDYRRQKAKKIWAELSDTAGQLKFLPAQDRELWRDFMYEKLIIGRNRIWMPRLMEILPHKPTLVAVGSAHLFGRQGLIFRLHQAGYQVHPLNANTLPTPRKPDGPSELFQTAF